MSQRKLFKMISQNPDRVKTFCTDMDNPLNFAIRKWMIKQYIDMVLVFRKTLPLNSTFKDIFNDLLEFFPA